MKKKDSQAPTILVHTGKDELNKKVCTALHKVLAEQQFADVVLKSITTDEEVLTSINQPQNKPIMLIVKPSGMSERWLPAVEARLKKITTIIWSRHVHHRKPSQMHGALFVGIPPKKSGTIESLARLMLVATTAIQTHEDDNTLRPVKK
ncbi:MAG: hypothetical protein PHG25_03185 [Candidatus Pacebacteria bacterium]|nr:hypothetical protein [Candidatus Paceibacterota bacterium]